jgi:uncharacterized protein (DUF849 family)
MANKQQKVIICAALAGAATMKNQNSAVPYIPEEFAEESTRCFDAGAATPDEARAIMGIKQK